MFSSGTPNLYATPTPTPSSGPSRVTYPRIFPASTSILTNLTKGFTHSLPISTATPAPLPYSDSPPRVKYSRIFSRLYLNLHHFLKWFYSGTPHLRRHPSTIPPRPHTLKCCSMAVHILLGCISSAFSLLIKVIEVPLNFSAAVVITNCAWFVVLAESF